MTVKTVLGLLLAVALAGCASNQHEIRIDVESHWDADTDYSKYMTWDFVPGTVEYNLPALQDPALRGWIAETVERELADRGRTRNFVSPDFRMGYYATVEPVEERELREAYGDFTWALEDYEAGPDRTWPKGMLFLFAFDDKTGEMLWRSSAAAVFIEERTLEQRKEIVKDAIQLMLDELPRRQQ